MGAGLSDIVELAKALPSMEDRRPGWLRALARVAGDPPYYRLLHEIGLRFRPRRVLEIGTYEGVSAAHLAADPGTLVVTVDVVPAATEKARAIGLQNVRAIAHDSVSLGAKISRGEFPIAVPFDLLFVDGESNFNQAYGEYMAFRPLMAPGGVVLFDDIRLPMETREMDVFWDYVVDPKAELPGMHKTGFGACEVDPVRRLPPWEEVIGRASARWLGKEAT